MITGYHSLPYLATQPKLFPEVLRRRLIVRIRNHFIQARHKFHISKFHKLALHHVTRGEEQDRSEHQRDIIGDEGGEAAEEEDDGDSHDTVPCCAGLEGGFKWEAGSVETLGIPAGSEAEVGLSS